MSKPVLRSALIGCIFLGLMTAGCSGDEPSPPPELVLGDGFAPGEVFLVVPPDGFRPAAETVAGWQALAVDPHCTLAARTGTRPTRDGDDPRGLTVDLLDHLATLDGGRAEISEATLAFQDATAPGIPALAATWTASDGPVRALARVVVSYEYTGELTTGAVAVRLRCTDEGASTMAAVWDQVTTALRVQLPPTATTWDRPER